MIKKYAKILIITSVVIIFPIIAGMILWQRLPSEIPTHFDANGVANDYSSKAFAVFVIPLFILFMHLLCFFGTLADPKKSGYGKNMLTLVLWICPCVSVLCGFVMYSAALGYDFNVGFIMSLFIGIVFTLIGNYLPKCKRNYTIGIKLPWTINSDENWNRTHRVAGFLWVLGGLEVIATSFFANIWIMLSVVVVLTAVPTIYSYVYYVKNEKEGE